MRQDEKPPGESNWAKLSSQPNSLLLEERFLTLARCAASRCRPGPPHATGLLPRFRSPSCTWAEQPNCSISFLSQRQLKLVDTKSATRQRAEGNYCNFVCVSPSAAVLVHLHPTGTGLPTRSIFVSFLEPSVHNGISSWSTSILVI